MVTTHLSRLLCHPVKPSRQKVANNCVASVGSVFKAQFIVLKHTLIRGLTFIWDSCPLFTSEKTDRT